MTKFLLIIALVLAGACLDHQRAEVIRSEARLARLADQQDLQRFLAELPALNKKLQAALDSQRAGERSAWRHRLKL